jgi:hypothetical protein
VSLLFGSFVRKRSLLCFFDNRSMAAIRSALLIIQILLWQCSIILSSDGFCREPAELVD